MKKILMTVAVALGALGTAFAAASSGNCESKAVTLKSSQSFALVDEWDPDEKEHTGLGVYYFKVSLKNGSACSIWIEGESAGDMLLDVYTDSDSDYWTSFESGQTSDGSIQFARLASGDWDEEDPGTVPFYVLVTGDVGAQATIHMEGSYREFEPLGSEANKQEITFAEAKPTTTTADFLGGEYWMSAKLDAGRLYRIRTAGGTDDCPFGLDVDTDMDDATFEVLDDVQYATDTNNTACVIFPKTKGTYFIKVTAYGSNQTFSVIHELLKARTPAAHNPASLESLGYTAMFVPGRKIVSWDYADDVIDENLYSISLNKGDKYVFETTGATSPTLIQVYDAKGTVLAQNETKDGVGDDVRTVIEAPSAGMYYVGVCNTTLAPYEEVTGSEVTLTAVPIAAIDGDPDEWDAADDVAAGASSLEVVPGTYSSTPQKDGSTHGPHRLSVTDWTDTFVIAARKDITYRVGVTFDDAQDTSPLSLAGEVFTLSGTTERLVAKGDLHPAGVAYFEFKATANAAYYIRFSVAEGKGLDYPPYNVKSMAYTLSGANLGILTVNTWGAPAATWSIGSESAKYPGGSSVLVSGNVTVKLSSVKGYKASAATTNVTVEAGTKPTVVDVYYSDTFDPKDDTAAGATSLTLKNVDTVYATRTLWGDDPADNFSIAGTDGYYYDLALRNVDGDKVVFSITNPDVGVLAENVTSVRQLVMPKTKSKYILTVANGDGATAFGGYTLAGKFANVGAIKFDKTAISFKEDAASAAIKVKRTAKDGFVRVKYGTVAGTAKPGVDYVAQNGVLEWANGDNKDKTITIKLLPDLVPEYEGNKTFAVQLKAFEEDERTASEYPASILGGDTCTVTLTETSKAGTTAADAYAKKAPKLATVKTEDVPLESGSYYGVLFEDGFRLTNGLPALASVTFTAGAKTPVSLSAKVALAGKNYTFSAKGWDDDAAEGFCKKEFLLAQKVNKIDEETGKSVSVMVTNTLTITVAAGATATDGDWLKSGGTAELVMNVPDANGKGYQEEIVYSGAIYRNNAKIQGYLTAVTNFVGYYTVALAPEGVSSFDGVPAGNGYMTLTVDNKGTVKVAGLLADGSTKPSLSATACAIVEDASSANGYSMYVPIFYAKSPVVFGGTLRLYANDEGVVVVDSSEALVWNNDNAKLTYAGEEGYRLSLDPVGGWYDTVFNLQAYYLNYLFEVGTADISEFPAEMVGAGYSVVTDVQPNGSGVDLAANAFTTAKQALVKNGALYDLAASVNPCNVQLKFARATGLVSGTFSIWSETEDGSAQKEIKGIKHNGVLILARDASSPFSDDMVSAGFCTQSVKLTDVDEASGKTSTRNWTLSLPFNLIGVDQGDIDWWADDWGEDIQQQ